MSDLSQLYQDLIFDHHKYPKCYGKPDHVSSQIETFNPLCGDRMTVFHDGEKMTFEGRGCALSIASASLVLEKVQKLEKSAIRQVISDLFDMLDGRVSGDQKKTLGKLLALENVKQYPARVKCVTLAWHAISQLIDQEEAQNDAITTCASCNQSAT